jgi:hypothetical protein
MISLPEENWQGGLKTSFKLPFLAVLVLACAEEHRGRNKRILSPSLDAGVCVIILSVSSQFCGRI